MKNGQLNNNNKILERKLANNNFTRSDVPVTANQESLIGQIEIRQCYFIPVADANGRVCGSPAKCSHPIAGFQVLSGLFGIHHSGASVCFRQSGEIPFGKIYDASAIPGTIRCLFLLNHVFK